MTKTRTIGTLAAIGGVTATIALLTGLPAASADELADLRANQELLQRRIDQLAQGLPEQKQSPGSPGAMGTAPIPGQAIVGGSFPRSFLIPGTDTSIRVGGFIDLTGALLFRGRQQREPGHPVVELRPKRQSECGADRPTIRPRPRQCRAVGQPFARQRSSSSAARSRRGGMSRPAPRRPGASRGHSSSSTSAGCNNFSCQTVQQAGGNSLIPRLRFAYGTLGGFLGGQAISNFSDADADTESVEFGGAMGSTGGARIPQVRYTLAGPWGGAFSFSAENPTVSVNTPSGIVSSRHQYHRDGARRAAPKYPRDLQWACPAPAREPRSRAPSPGLRAQPHRRLLLGAALGPC